MERLIFIHLHKTGGTSLLGALRRMLEKRRCFFIDGVRFREHIESFKQLEPHERDRYDAILGHQYFGLHSELGGASRYYAMLRRPLDRLVSLYNYLYREPLFTGFERLHRDRPGFLEFVRGNYSIAADNGMTRFIAGHDSRQTAYGACDRTTLDTAIRNIEKHFVGLGFTEHFDASLLELRATLGLRRLPVYRKVNVTGRREEAADRSPDLIRMDTVTAADRAAARPYLQLDEQLYDFARDRFLGRVIKHEHTALHFVQRAAVKVRSRPRSSRR